MEKYRGFDYSGDVKLYGFGKSIKASDPELKEKLRAQYEQIKKETGLELVSVGDYDDILSGNDFDTNFEYFVEGDIREYGKNISFRICENVSDETLMIYNNVISGEFEDECEWDEETEEAWNNLD